MAKSAIDMGILEVGNPAAAFVSDGLISDITEYLDTGSYILNAAVSGSIFGGYPRGIVTAFAGEPATGKTYLCMDAVSSFHQRYENGIVVWFDTEQAVESTDFNSRPGIDPNRIKVQPVATVEQFRTEITKMLVNYLKLPESQQFPLLFILDSLGNLSTNKETTDIETGNDKRDMTKPQLIKGAFRTITLKLGMARATLLVTNHVYSEIGVMFPTPQIAGGSGLKYCSSNIIMLGKAKEKDGTDVIGNQIRCKMYKSRKTKENKIVSSRIFYDTGIDRYFGLLDLAEKYGIATKVGNKYQFEGSDKAFFEKAIYKEPEKYFTDEIMTVLDFVAHKEYMYGNAFEMWCEAKGYDPEKDRPVPLETKAVEKEEK